MKSSRVSSKGQMSRKVSMGGVRCLGRGASDTKMKAVWVGWLTGTVCYLNSRSTAIEDTITFQHWKTGCTDEHAC